MNPLSKWLWPDADIRNDQYAEFHDSFTFSGQWAVLEISADSNYAVYLNGLLVSSGQYPDFPHYKVYDRVDLTPHCRDGKTILPLSCGIMVSPI